MAMSQKPWDSLTPKMPEEGRAGLCRGRQWLRSMEPTPESTLWGLYLLSLFFPRQDLIVSR